MRTLEQIRHEGLKALRESLGRSGMLRFLAQFENGSGDYAKDRHEWVDRTSLDELQDIARDAARLRSTDQP